MIGSKAVLLALATVLQAAPGAPKGWKPYTSTKGAYTASFPAKPTERKSSLTLPEGKVEVGVTSVKRGVTAFSIASGELKSGADDADATLDAARDGLVKQTKGKLADETPIDLDGHPGRDLKIDIPKNVVAGGATTRARIYVIGDRIYELVATLPAADLKTRAGEVDGFFASFRPKVKAAAPRVVAKKEAAKPAKPAGKTKAGWEPFTSAEGRFTVALPGEPKELTQSVNTPLGKQDVHLFVVERPDQTSFVVTFSDYPPGTVERGNVDQVLDGAKNGAVAGAGGTMVAESKIKLGDVPGREVKYETNNPQLGGAGLAISRIYLDKGRIYQLIYGASKALFKEEEARSLFDSFQILDAGKAAELAKAVKPAEGAIAPGWRTFRSDEWGFSCQFPPGEPMAANKEVTGPDGVSKIHQFVIPHQRANYLAGCSEGPKAMDAERVARQELAGYQAGIVGKGKLLSGREVRLGPLFGREFSYEPNLPNVPAGAVAKGRCFIKGNRFYSVTYMELSKGSSDGLGDKFLDTLRIDGVEATTVENKPDGAEADWVEFTPPGKGFKALLPEKPQEKSLTNPANNQPFPEYLAASGATSFVIRVGDLPPNAASNNPTRALDSVQKSALGPKGRLISQRDLTLNGLTCREFTFVPSEKEEKRLPESTTARMRAVFTSRHVFIFGYVAISPEDGKRLGDKFFGAFALTEK